MSKHRRFYIKEDTPLLRRILMKTFEGCEPVPPFPEDIQIQTITGCNASCVFCPNGKTKNPIKPARMDDGLYQKIIDECLKHRVKRISPYLMNEPMLDRKKKKKIRYIADRKPAKLSIKINSNASMLKGEMIEQILNSGLDRLNISFHGISKEVYEESMQGLNHGDVLGNINRFIEEKQRRNLKKPKVTIVMVKTKLVADEIDSIKNYWKQRNVSTHIRAMENRASDAVQGRNLNPDKWQPFHWCKRLFTQAYILATGDVVLCCVDWERTTILGNLREKTLEEVWNSEKAVSIRRKFLSGDFRDILCSNCLKQAGI